MFFVEREQGSKMCSWCVLEHLCSLPAFFLSFSTFKCHQYKPPWPQCKRSHFFTTLNNCVASCNTVAYISVVIVQIFVVQFPAFKERCSCMYCIVCSTNCEKVMQYTGLHMFELGGNFLHIINKALWLFCGKVPMWTEHMHNGIVKDFLFF